MREFKRVSEEQHAHSEIEYENIGDLKLRLQDYCKFKNRPVCVMQNGHCSQ